MADTLPKSTVTTITEALKTVIDNTLLELGAGAAYVIPEEGAPSIVFTITTLDTTVIKSVLPVQSVRSFTAFVPSLAAELNPVWYKTFDIAS